MRISDWSSDVCSSDLLQDEGALAGPSRPQDQCARPLLQPAAEKRVELAQAAAPRPPVEALAVLGRDQAREHLHAPGPDDHVVMAAAECLPAIDRKSTRLNSSH